MELNYTCAETILWAANDAWGMKLPEISRLMMGGFGGGMSYGVVCGGISGGIAALSCLYNEKNGHESPFMRRVCHKFIKEVNEKMGELDCSELRPKYGSKLKEKRCIQTIKMIAEVLDKVYDEAVREKSIIE